MEISALENASRTSIAWSPEGYDGQRHVTPIVMALAPAIFLIGIAAFVLSMIH
jgi:hypothetical protein